MEQALLSKRQDLAASSDEKLLEVARLGDESAIRILVKRNNQRLFRVARAILHNDFEAEDVVQETYVRAFTKLASFRGDARFTTWLTRIAINEALGRKRRTRPMVNFDDVEEAALASSRLLPKPPLSLAPLLADKELMRTESRAALERAIEELPEIFRIVLVLRDVEGMNVEDTAELLGIKPATVKTRLHRAHRMVGATIGRDRSEAFSDAFPFGGARCAEMAGRVIWDLQWQFDRAQAQDRPLSQRREVH
jgi:RNA polymerase sigma-70 factor, ECF subfamily